MNRIPDTSLLTLALCLVLAALQSAFPADADAQRLLTTLGGHTAPVVSASFSPDGSLILTASADGTTRLWDAHTYDLLRVLAGHAGAVTAATFNAMGSLVATGGIDSTVRLWRPSTGDSIATLRGGTGRVRWLSFSVDNQYLGGTFDDGSAVIWELATMTPTRLADTGGGIVFGTFDYNPTPVFWTVQTKGVIQAWDVHYKDWATPIGLPMGTDRAIFGSPRSRIAMVYGNRVLASRGLPVQGEEFSGHATHVRGGDLSNAGWTAATADSLGALVWDTEMGEVLFAIDGVGPINDIRFSPDAMRVITACESGAAQVWDATIPFRVTRPYPGALYRPGDTVVVRWVGSSSFNTGFLGAGSPRYDSTQVELIDRASGTAYNLGHSSGSERFAWIAFDSLRGEFDLRVADMGHGRSRTRDYYGALEPVRYAAISSDSRQLLAVSEDGMARYYDVTTGALLRAFQVADPRGIYVRAVLSRDWTRLATGSIDSISIWDGLSGRMIARLPSEIHQVRILDFSPDAKRVGATGDGAGVYIWDVASKALLKLLGKPGLVGKSVAFSPNDNGARVLTTWSDDSLRMYDLASGAILFTRFTGTRPGHAIFSHDGRFIASGSSDGDLRVFDALGDTVLVRRLRGSLADILFTNDDQQLVANTNFGTITFDMTTKLIDSAAPGASGGAAVYGYGPGDSLLLTSGDYVKLRIERLNGGSVPEYHGGGGFIIADGIPQTLREIDFGEISSEAMRDSTLSGFITNQFEGWMTIDSMVVVGPDASVFIVRSALPMRGIAPHAVRDIELRFSPLGWVHYEDTLLVYSGPYVGRVPIRGTGGKPMSVETEKGPRAGRATITALSILPGNDRMVVDIDLAMRTPFTLELCDAMGRDVSRSLSTGMDAGSHRLELDCSMLPSGAYFCVLRTARGMAMHPCILRR